MLVYMQHTGLSLGTNPSPPPRMNAHAVIVDNVLYIYGGLVENSRAEVTLNDMWSLDLAKRDGWKCIYEGLEFDKVFKGDLDSSGDDFSDMDDEKSLSFDSNTDSDTDSRGEMAEPDDLYSRPVPKRNEKLADYYLRCKDFWISLQDVASKTAKEIKTESFEACKQFYLEYNGS
ncbi:Kelch-type beta propeller [Babesia duncani]|uniref:Kelch-type beta propeller n=1 Tax=Babesia duncani TaxID=323732 RepID=A0AAD9PLD1_9APIC|nr:Kelch-type beta propeller [Babesia duncani]KAK2196528.1 Kelch-type beta propeller [Babesia duncani]